MAEYLGNLNEEIASGFITGTCELIPKSCPFVPDHMHAVLGFREQRSKCYFFPCGSSAEFYIQPFNTCISDTDALLCCTDGLALSGDLPVLPNDVSGLLDTIEWLKIEPYYDRYPGFVRLRGFGKMNFNWKCKKYEFNPIDH